MRLQVVVEVVVMKTSHSCIESSREVNHFHLLCPVRVNKDTFWKENVKALGLVFMFRIVL